MIKKILVSFSVLAALSLGACATTTSSDVSAQIAEAQAIAVKACGFLPTVATVSAIISTFVPGASQVNSVATQVATSICDAIAPKSAARKMGVPTVNGVIIKGEYVR